jgi:DNA replication licensing factor MCM7
MDENDRTSIHEVMEQQTISISKAGINTTLNARTSILAAANPYYGRYDRRRKATENINLPAALLSRFDLLFLILDTPNPEDDIRLAQHIAYVHMHNKHPEVNNGAQVIDSNLIRHYIATARSHVPKFTPTVSDFLVNAYVKMRKDIQETSEFQYTCARTLLSIMRLSSALARLRFANEVDVSDVEEAMRLIEVSKSSISESSRYKNRDPVQAVFEEIRNMSTKANGEMFKTIDLNDVKERIIRKGFGEDVLGQCITQYERIHIWMRIAGGDKLQWLQVDDFE